MIVINNDKNLCKVEIPDNKKSYNKEIIKANVLRCKQSSTDCIYSAVVNLLLEDGIKFSSERDVDGNYVINFH